jgi:predicted ATPase
MDTGSWMLVAQAAQDIAGLLPVLLARPAPDGDWPGMERLALTAVDRLRLSPLSRTAIGRVIHEALGAEPPDEWSDALAERSGGNPCSPGNWRWRCGNRACRRRSTLSARRKR